MNMRKAHLFSSLGLVLFAAPAFGQLQVDNTQTPLELLQNVLLGEGVTVTNVTYNGVPGDVVDEQAGSFTGALGSIGLESGIMLATGNVNVALGPNDEGGSTEGGGNAGVGDPDLEILAGVTTNDASILEFDFVPVGDSITFRYVFASEEYNEYVCGTVNDVFGFFLSGPGITGPFSGNAANLALVPGSVIPVSINTVNNGTVGDFGQEVNCSSLDPNWTGNNIYYLDNGASIEVQFDGQTVVLTARAEVVCGETYHIKMAIADGGDTAFDSAVFLEAGSFLSTPFIPTLTPGPGIVGTNTILESCYPVTLDFLQQGAGEDTSVVYITVGGTATPGEDYVPAFPDSLIFLPGDTVQSFTFTCPIDLDGQETIILTLTSESVCSGISIVNEFIFFIESVPNLFIEGGFAEIPCLGSTVLTPTLGGGYPPYAISWSDGSNGTSLAVAPLDNTVYTATVTDDCGSTALAQFFVDLTPLEPVVMTILGSNTLLEACESSQLNIIRPQGVAGDLTVTLTGSGDAQAGADYVLPGSTIIPADVLNVQVPFAPLEDGISDDGELATITATVTDACGRTATASVTLTILDAPPITLSGEDLLIPCSNDSVLLVVDATGGVGILDLEWSTGDIGNATWVSTAVNANYTVSATDDCERTVQETIEVELICDVVIPNVITPNGDVNNQTFFIEGIQYVSHTVRIYNRWGQVVFEANNYRNNWSANGLPDGTYYYEVLVPREPKPFTGHVTILRNGW
jgi:gliding motility-associated-like protein